MIGEKRSADTVDFRDAPARMLGVALHEYGSPHQFKVQLCVLPREIKDHEVLVQVKPSSPSASNESIDASIRMSLSIALSPSPSPPFPLPFPLSLSLPTSIFNSRRVAWHSVFSIMTALF